MEETIPAFGVTFAKPFLLKIQYSKPSIIIEIWTLHISAFVNMTNIIVKSYTVLYMCAWKLSFVSLIGCLKYL